MKTVSIKIIIPKKGERWKVSLNNGRFERPDAINVYNYVERRLLASSDTTKIKVYVDYNVLHPSDPEGWINKGVYAERENALYALACFLEDFIPHATIKEKYKKYGGFK